MPAFHANFARILPSFHPASKKHKKYAAQEAAVCKWYRRERGPHLIGGGSLGRKYGRKIRWEIFLVGKFIIIIQKKKKMRYPCLKIMIERKKKK